MKPGIAFLTAVCSGTQVFGQLFGSNSPLPVNLRMETYHSGYEVQERFSDVDSDGKRYDYTIASHATTTSKTYMRLVAEDWQLSLSPGRISTVAGQVVPSSILGQSEAGTAVSYTTTRSIGTFPNPLQEYTVSVDYQINYVEFAKTSAEVTLSNNRYVSDGFPIFPQAAELNITGQYSISGPEVNRSGPISYSFPLTGYALVGGGPGDMVIDTSNYPDSIALEGGDFDASLFWTRSELFSEEIDGIRVAEVFHLQTSILNEGGPIVFRAIPEPKTYTLIAGIMLAGLALFRRRRGLQTP